MNGAGIVRLLPYRSIAVRLALWLIIVVAQAPALTPVVWPVVGVLFVVNLAIACLLGTFPRTWIDGNWLKRQFFVAFIPVRLFEHALDDTAAIETDTEEMPFSQQLLGGPDYIVTDWLMGWVLPWLGGDYKIYLRHHRGHRFCVWQGNGEKRFRHNLALLEQAVGLRATRG